MSKTTEQIEAKLASHKWKPGTHVLYGPSGIPLPVGMLRFESIYKAQHYEGNVDSPAKFSFQLLIPKEMNDAQAELWATVCKVAKETHKQKKYPKTEKIGWEFFKDGDLKAQDLKENDKEYKSYEGKWVVNATCKDSRKNWKTGIVEKFTPAIVDRSGQPYTGTLVAGMMVIPFIGFTASARGISCSFDRVVFHSDLGVRFATSNFEIETPDTDIDPSAFGIDIPDTDNLMDTFQ
jgi:hypothetical protein